MINDGRSVSIPTPVGKNSTVTLRMMLELGECIDEVTTVNMEMSND